MKITVDAVDFDEQRQLWRASLTITADDGSSVRHQHLFPVDTMEWRAAEYGIDPADTATLLDIVLAEPFLTPDDWAAGEQLYTAPDIDTARRDHVARCSAAKLRCRLSTRAKGSPLVRVRDESPLHAEVIELKTELVAQGRRQEATRRRRRVAVAPRSGAERAARLRAQWFPEPPAAKDEEI